jgi:alpha-glucosidase (family GH31 glycosyl hydrolase)
VSRRGRLAGAILLTLAAAPAARAAPIATLRRTGDRLQLRTAVATAEVRLGRYQLRLLVRRRRLLTAEHGRGGVFYERGGVVHRLKRVRAVRAIADGAELVVDTDEGQPAGVRLRWRSPRTLKVVVAPPAPETLAAVGDRWRSPKSELIYGLSERLRDSPPLPLPEIEIPAEDIRPDEVGSLDRRGETVEMLVRPTIALYAPFYQSSRGYGLAVAGTTIGLFDVARSDPRSVAFRFETGSTPESRELVFHLFVGPDHATILDEYTALTGRPFVPPAWAFLHWRWRDELPPGQTALLDGVAVNAKVAEDVLMCEQLAIPPGVYHLDRPVLAGEFGFARFAFDEERVPHAVEMLASLRARRYRLSIWSAAWACGSMPGDHGLEAQALGFLAPGARGTPRCADIGGRSFILDVTSPAARAWWRDKLGDFLAAYGIDAVKLDRGEEHIPTAAPDVWADGRTGREVRNAYPVLQAAMHHEALARARGDGDFVLWSRSAYTGAQRWAIFWGGDTAGSETFGGGPGTALGLRSAIIAQQRAAFMGFPIWGSDTGGYYQFKDREVFARWIEFSAFSGLMEIGGQGSHAPWDMPTEPRYDQEMIDIYRRYTRLREALLDYIVAAARRAGERGLPIVRPLVFLDRHDPELRDRWDQYLFGPDLMVAPVWRVGDRSRRVYFPRGAWRSYWNHAERYRGPHMVTVEAPLDVIPVFVRGDAVVP